MIVQIVLFPETPVAVIEHRGDPATETDTVRKLVAWKLKNGLTNPQNNRHYGLHYGDPKNTAADQHRVEFCLSVDGDIAQNSDGITARTLPARRCALARDIGSRHNNQAIVHLMQSWLPSSGESLGALPVIFHYVNVGPNVRPADMITDVYLPLA